jgi:hypothetical protein
MGRGREIEEMMVVMIGRLGLVVVFCICCFGVYKIEFS